MTFGRFSDSADYFANPSVEGTCNGGLRWFALQASVAPSHVPHVKCYRLLWHYAKVGFQSFRTGPLTVRNAAKRVGHRCPVLEVQSNNFFTPPAHTFARR